MADSGENQDILSGETSLFLLSNIPSQFRSYNLRAYFSHLIEEEAFKCFHFRHRPEYHRGTVTADNITTSTSTSQQDQSYNTSLSSEETRQADTCCCVLLIKNGRHKEELLKYNGRHWTDINDDLMKRKVKLQQLSLKEETTQEVSESSTSQRSLCFDKNLILSLPELHPPGCMPQGNVGTSIKVFRELIRTCRLPPRAIKKLKLVFPSSLKRYGAVPLDYGPSRKEGGITLRDMERETAKRTKGKERRDEDQSNNKKKRKKKVRIEEEINEEEYQYDDNDDFDAEDWERYEALHNDVDKQERTGERLFEEEMEVTWDKGSSGLVFYTDASYWDQMDNAGDFDEKCSQEDDWDVDMSLYYGYKSADKAAMDMRDMEIEKRLRSGEDLQDIMMSKKKHPKENYGSKLMKEKGWREGTGLGKTSSGISSPIEAEGQSSRCKTGLGYHGEKLVRKPIQKRTREVLIPTIYDKRDEEQDTIIQSTPPTTLKYRKV